MLIISIILFQVFIFIGLIYVFRRILTRNVILATRHLDELNQDYNKKEKEADRRLEEAKQKSEDILSKAREEVGRQKTQIIKETEEERDRIIKQARTQSQDIIQQADKTRQLLISELDEKVSKAAIEKACELIQSTLPEEFKKNVHLHWTEELIGESADQLAHLHIPDDVRKIKIASAFPLNEGQRKGLSRKLKQLLGRDITLKEEVDPRIVAGLVVTIGSLVLDGSLKNKIEEQARSIEGEGSR